MSTLGSPYGELPPTHDAEVALDSHDHHWFAEPTEPVSRKYIAVLVIAQLVFFVALLGAGDHRYRGQGPVDRPG